MKQSDRCHYRKEVDMSDVISIKRLKAQAKELKAADSHGQPHTYYLDRVAKTYGFDSWAKLQNATVLEFPEDACIQSSIAFNKLLDRGELTKTEEGISFTPKPEFQAARSQQLAHAHKVMEDRAIKASSLGHPRVDTVCDELKVLIEKYGDAFQSSPEFKDKKDHYLFGLEFSGIELDSPVESLMVDLVRYSALDKTKSGSYWQFNPALKEIAWFELRNKKPFKMYSVDFEDLTPDSIMDWLFHISEKAYLDLGRFFSELDVAWRYSYGESFRKAA